MAGLNFKNALVSVSDKTGLADFLRPLVANGLRILSTGGTAKYLQENGIPIVQVSDQTKFPEVMDGRVKTLHPNIHMALLARTDNAEDTQLLKKYGVDPIDLVIVNLYPFEDALKKQLPEGDLIEFIDIGGPSMLRSAAKSFARIAVVCDPRDYQWIQQKEKLTFSDHKKLAAKVFAHTAAYDSMIANTLANQDLEHFCLGGEMISGLRYGENPQQKAVWYRQKGQDTGLHRASILQGKELSYNNILDLEAACATLREFSEPCTVAVKHNNPCGVGLGVDGRESVERAFAADPVSVFGGIVAINVAVDAIMAEQLNKVFLECVIAPKIDSSAVAVFSKKKNLRILEWPEMKQQKSSTQIKSVSGGFLVQTADEVQAWDESWQCLREKPNEEIRDAIALAWKVCANLKSNAIAIASSRQTLGMGMGQVNRVDAVEQAIGRMNQHHPGQKNIALASDAFFPFADSIEHIARAGIRWVVQPGGSVRDEEVINRADQLGVNLVMTGRRHFRH